MSATPASRPIASLTALKSRSRSKTSLTRSMNTNERILRNASCSACSTLRKNTEALVTDVDTSHSTKISGLRGRIGFSLMTTGTPGVVRGEIGLRLGPQAERTADALHVDADDAGPLALAAERRDRQAGEVAH